MKKLIIVLFTLNILNAQKTRAEILEMAVTLNWKIDSTSSNQIKLTANEEQHELGLSPLELWIFYFDGSYQSSKLIEAVQLSATKIRYVMEVYFKDAPRVKESKIINSYKGEKYCSCYYILKMLE